MIILPEFLRCRLTLCKVYFKNECNYSVPPPNFMIFGEFEGDFRINIHKYLYKSIKTEYLCDKIYTFP